MNYTFTLKTVFVLSLYLLAGKAKAIDTLFADRPVTQDVKNYSEWAYTDMKKSTVEDAVKILESNGFSKFKNGDYAENSVGKSIWLHLVFKNITSSDRNYLWAIYWQNVSVTAYEKVNGTYVRTDSISTYMPYGKRPYPMATLAVSVHTKSSETKDILLRILPYEKGKMWFQQSFDTELQTRIKQIDTIGFTIPFASLLFILFLFNAALAFMYRSWLFFWQTLYILLLFTYNSYEYYLHAPLPDAVFGWLNRIHKLTWLNAAAFSIVFVFMRITKLSRISPPAYSFLIKSLYIYGICFWQMMLIQLLMPLFTDDVSKYTDLRYISLSIANYATEIMMCIHIVISAVIFKRVNTSTRIFILALVFTIICAMAYASNGFWGIIGSDWLTPQMLSGGLVVEIFLFTFITFYQIYTVYKDRLTLLDQNLLFQRTLTQEVISARETERKRIAQDLHDDVGGTLGALKLLISSPNMEKQRAYALISKAVIDLRQISHNLLPAKKSRHVPFQTIVEQIDEINRMDVLHIQNGIETPKTPIPISVETNVSRIVSELLTNVLKHAKATEATIQIHDENNIMQIIVEDNGIGFPTAESHSGIGLQNVTSRVEFLKGTINIDSNQYGTTIIIEIPLTTNKT